MSLKRGEAPKTIKAKLTIKGQGREDTLEVVYFNRKESEIDAKIAEKVTFAGLIPFIVESWDTDFPVTEQGALEFEDEYVGIVAAVVQGFYRARRKELQGN